MILIYDDMFISMLTNFRLFQPYWSVERPLSAVFAQHLPHRPAFVASRGVVRVRIFTCGPFFWGQDESAGFPGYSARDILESFTGEKLLPS